MNFWLVSYFDFHFTLLIARSDCKMELILSILVEYNGTMKKAANNV